MKTNHTKAVVLALCMLFTGQFYAQNLIYENNFNQVSEDGRLTTEQAKKAIRTSFVKGAEEGRVHIANVSGRGKVLEAKYPKGGVKTGNSGFLTKVPFDKEGDYEELYLSYWIYIPADFDFRAGAKIPGLGYQTSERNMSLRLMWRYDGLLEYYVHYNTPSSKNTIQINWTLEGNPYDQPQIPFPDQARLKKGAWNHIELYNKLNTPGVENGIMRGWLNGKLGINITDNGDYRRANEGDIKLNIIYMSTFFGGSDETFQPTKDQYAYFDDFKVSTSRIGYPGGGGGGTPTPPANASPKVTLTGPAGTTFTEGANITLAANATDSDGTIQKVAFYRGNTKLGEDTTKPYTYNLNNVSNGSYIITARATDNDGAVKISEPKTIIVSSSTNPNPTPTPPTGGPEGYTFSANEGGTVNVSGTVDIAYGADGEFSYLTNISSNTPCTNAVFGDPISGVVKKCYIRSVATPNPTPDPTPSPSGCDFNTPTANSLPSFNRVAYQTVSVLGNGPDLSNVRELKINWNAAANGLYQFAVKTRNGQPAYYIDLRNKIDENFGSSNPGLTINNSGVSGLDGAYWVAKDGSNFVMVSKSGNFSIYYSNGAAPNCNTGAKAANTNTVAAMVASPVPASTNVTLSNLPSNTMRIAVYNLHGQLVISNEDTQNTNAIQLNVSSLKNGLYFAEAVAQSGETYRTRIVISN